MDCCISCGGYVPEGKLVCFGCENANKKGIHNFMESEFTEIDNATRGLFNVYKSLTGAGFTEEQAIKLLH